MLNRKLFYEACDEAKQVYSKQKETYYSNKLQSYRCDTRNTYKIVIQLLDKQFGVKQNENNFENDHEAACEFAEFFIKKVNDISSSFISQSVFDSGSDALVNDVTGSGVLSHELGGSAYVVPVFSTFEKLSCSDLKTVIDSMNSKTCDLDPMPTPLLLKCIKAILPPSVDIVNMSLITGIVPSSLKHASITPLLKNQSADRDVMINYKPVSNLSFTSKLIENCVYFRVSSHLETNFDY